MSEAQPRIITAADELDKSEAEAFLEGRTTTPPTRRVTIVVINPQSQQAARVLFELPDNRILAVESIPASDVPFSKNDADEALALAVANPNLRRLVGDNLNRFQIFELGSEARVPFAAQALPVRSTDPRDVCSTDRCVDLIFRTEDGYLPFRAHVNLARGTVEIQAAPEGSIDDQHISIATFGPRCCFANGLDRYSERPTGSDCASDLRRILPQCDHSEFPDSWATADDVVDLLA